MHKHRARYVMRDSIVEERFEILRRILDRMKDYGEVAANGIVIDYVQHLRNEIELLKQECDMKTQSTLRNAR